MSRLETHYNRITSLRADFSQTISSAFDSESARITGRLVMAGKKYRYETDEQTFVTDGVTAWIYLPEENQVLINDYVEDEQTFSPEQFFVDYEKNYNVALLETRTIDGDRHYVLELTPKSADSFFQKSVVYMRDRDNMVTRMDVTDVNDTRLLFELKNIRINAPLDAATFTFEPPAGAEVVNLRS